MNETYYKFPIRYGLEGVVKISHSSEINYLIRLAFDGYTHLGYNQKFHFFQIDRQLSRKLKLSLMVDSEMQHNIKFLNDIIRRSFRIEREDCKCTNVVTFTSFDWYYYDDYKEMVDETKIKREEQKQFRNRQNNLYNQKLKMKR